MYHDCWCDSYVVFFVIRFPAVGGIGGAVAKLKTINPALVSPIGPPGIVPILSLVILTSLGSWGLPQMVHKFYTIKSQDSIRVAKWVSTGFALLITTGAYFTGSVSRLILGNQCPTINGTPVYDQIIPLVISDTLPKVVAAIILVLVLSASMSTLASLVLASSSAIAIDLLKKTVKPTVSNKTLMWALKKILCVVFVAISYMMATMNSPILNLASCHGSCIGMFISTLFIRVVLEESNEARSMGWNGNRIKYCYLWCDAIWIQEFLYTNYWGYGYCYSYCYNDVG